MEPPIALSDCLFFLPVTSVADYELGTLRKGFRSDDAGVSQIVADDQIYLASRLRRFLNAYLDSDKSRRADFRKAISFAAHQVEIESPASPTLEQDIATALVIAQKAADIAEATDIDETEDGIGLYSADSDLLLLADAFAALAFVYRYVVGIYATDPALGDLGEVAVRFALLAECEDNMALAATPVAFPVIPLMTSSACTANQEFESVLSMFVPTADQNDVAASLPEVVSRRPKESILLMA